MAMQAATVEILTQKAKFAPQVALAIAEAIDDAIGNYAHNTQPVTVPILDARLAELKSDLSRQMYTAMLGQMAVLLGIAYFFVTQVLEQLR
jgi:hypothetical protein